MKQGRKAYRDMVFGAQYIEMLRKRLILLREILADDGSLYVHLDWRAGHYIKVIMDEVFGKQNFLNECIWCFSSGGRPRNSYARKHAVLYYYKKGGQSIFNQQAAGATWGRKRRNNMKRNVDPDGRIYWSIKSGNKVYTYYEDDPLTPDDVWVDINHLQQKDPERDWTEKYPTQKPEKLLERIIKVSSHKDDIVLDAFAGSGTTLAVAEKLGRRWIGIDESGPAVSVIQKRMLSLSSIIGPPEHDKRIDYERVPDFDDHHHSRSKGLFFIFNKVRKGEFLLTDKFFKDLAAFLKPYLTGKQEKFFSLIYPPGKLRITNLNLVEEKQSRAGEKSITINNITFLLSEIREKNKVRQNKPLKAKIFYLYKADKNG